MMLTSSGLKFGISRVRAASCAAAPTAFARPAMVAVTDGTQSPLSSDVLRPPDDGVALNFFRQESAPISFAEISFGAPQAFRSARLVNFVDKQPRRVKTGWVLLTRAGRVVDYAADYAAVSPASGPNELVVQGHPTIDLPSVQAPARVMFFVAEVEYSDGSTWKENVGLPQLLAH